MRRETNPYEPPGASALAQGADPSREGHAATRELVLSWEQKRLLFNGVLLVEGLALTAPILVAQPSTGLFAVGFAVMANLCYFLGPLLESYWVALRGTAFSSRSRWAVFALGLGFSMGVTGLLGFAARMAGDL